MRHPSLPLLAGVLLLALPFPARGQVLFDGPSDSGNCLPFGCFDAGRRYQQVYYATAFGGAMTIRSISLFADESGTTGFQDGTYTIRLSTSPLSGVSGAFADNLGADVTTVFSGALAGAIIGKHTIALSTPFAYDPSSGHLVMDVVANTITDATYRWLDAYSGANHTVRLYNNSGGTSGTLEGGYGLKTEFAGDASSVAPEPVSMLLLGTGLAGIGAVRRRRRGEPA